MAKKEKYSKTIEIKGGVIFNNVDPYHTRFEMEANENLVGARRFQCPADILPADFEASKYDVKGEYSIKITVKEK